MSVNLPRWAPRTLLLVAPLVLAACGGGTSNASGVASLQDADAAVTDDSSAETATADDAADSDVDTEQQMLDFAQCMRDNGFDIGDPQVDADGRITFGDLGGTPGGGGGTGDGPPEGVREAFDACGDLIDGAQFGPGRGGPGGDVDATELQDTLVEFAQCMRDNGIQMDDPDFSDFGAPGGAPADGDGGGGGRGGLFGDLDQSDPAVQAGMEMCSDILGGFGPGGGGPPAGAPGGDGAQP